MLDVLEVPESFPDGNPQRAIYCSRTLNLRSIKAIGGWHCVLGSSLLMPMGTSCHRKPPGFAAAKCMQLSVAPDPHASGPINPLPS